MSESPAVAIRQASAADVAAVEAVVHEAFHPYVARIGAEPFPMRADYAALVEAGHVWVAVRRDPDVCGAVVLVPEADHLMLETVAVADEVRGTGVGAALMAFAEQRARALALSAVHLYTNELMWENLEYYPKLGYAVVGRGTVNDIYHRVFFTKAVR